jgi:CheY-like chemotaxis protein
MGGLVIVLAEDSAARLAIANILRGAGYAVELASRFPRACELARRAKAIAVIVAPAAYGRSDLQLLRKLAAAVSAAAPQRRFKAALKIARSQKRRLFERCLSPTAAQS